MYRSIEDKYNVDHLSEISVFSFFQGLLFIPLQHNFTCYLFYGGQLQQSGKAFLVANMKAGCINAPSTVRVMEAMHE